MAYLLLAIFLAIGTALGILAALVAAPEKAHAPPAERGAESAAASAEGPTPGPTPVSDPETSADGTAAAGGKIVPLGRRLIVPVVQGKRTVALMMLDVSLDLSDDLAATAPAQLPRLRDAFLQALFSFSYTGAFDRTYTDRRLMNDLRRTLRQAATEVLGDGVRDVLILDLLRQEF